jgi:hypothetical protein
MGTDEAQIKPGFRVVGVTQAPGRIRVSSEYLGRPEIFQEKANLETVFQIYG